MSSSLSTNQSKTRSSTIEATLLKSSARSKAWSRVKQERANSHPLRAALIPTSQWSAWQMPQQSMTQSCSKSSTSNTTRSERSSWCSSKSTARAIKSCRGKNRYVWSSRISRGPSRRWSYSKRGRSITRIFSRFLGHLRCIDLILAMCKEWAILLPLFYCTSKTNIKALWCLVT